MLTNKKIEELIRNPKYIIDAIPKKGMATDKKSTLIKRKNLKLKSTNGKYLFDVFMRQNTMLIEQFSIGLLYKPENKTLRTITMIRYNGEHGQSDWSKDNHYNAFHIHSINENLLKKNVYEPKNIEITNEFITFHSALYEFMRHVNIVNITSFFPYLDK